MFPDLRCTPAVIPAGCGGQARGGNQSENLVAGEGKTSINKIGVLRTLFFAEGPKQPTRAESDTRAVQSQSHTLDTATERLGISGVGGKW